MNKMLRSVAVFCVAGLLSIPSFAQDDVQTFRNFQFSFSRVSDAYMKYNSMLQKMFDARKLNYPPTDIYIRSFKAQNELELWARDSDTAEYTLINVYRICALSGILGPKRFEGDMQVPEGYYFIEDFNPKSNYHLSMMLNYPNYSDRVIGDKQKPGGDIYIHGGCLTVGCMPMTNDIIKELYTVCLNAKLNGQAYIPVHVFPTRFTTQSMNYLGRQFATDTAKQEFWVNLKYGYDYFERNHKIQPVMYAPDGKYIYSK